MLGGRDEAAEHDGIGTVSDQWLEQLRNGVELRIGGLGQALGLRDEGGERSVLFEAGGRLDIDGVAFVGIVVEHLFFKPIGIGGKAIAQRARRGSGRRANAAHQRQRAPECQPPATLIRSGALDHAKAVIKHGVMERAVSIGQDRKGAPRFRGAGRRAPRPNRVR